MLPSSAPIPQATRAIWKTSPTCNPSAVQYPPGNPLRAPLDIEATAPGPGETQMKNEAASQPSHTGPLTTRPPPQASSVVSRVMGALSSLEIGQFAFANVASSSNFSCVIPGTFAVRDRWIAVTAGALFT